MDINKMRNIVILKDLPSNLIDQAFVVLKENQKIKKLEYADRKTEKFSSSSDRDDENEYVVKEAELLISNYINKVENQDLIGRKNEKELMRKYKTLKIVSVVLGIFLTINCMYILR